MYLKRLELLGFKSFATRTTFEFGPGVTAIVGPNGSGKSNIAEALRWVLGEQGTRGLRGRRLEEVIFSGSSQRAPLGIAEVSITLDNTDGWLPVDFGEVAVTRRAYRSGESEHFINRSHVRQKDVVDLFLRAQSGQNSYAFMGQGLVEAILNLRPEERRGLIEEAADVRRHRLRLEEAHSRLRSTQDNLERVRLLLSEMRPRLAQLERQAERAATNIRLSRELAQALQEWYSQLWSAANDALAAARAAADQRQEECERLRIQVSACQEGLGALQDALDKRDREFAAREEERRDLVDRSRALVQQVTLEEERLALRASRRQELESEIRDLEAELAGLRSAMEADEARRAALEPDLAEARSAIERASASVAGLDSHLAAGSRRLEGMEERRRQAEARLQHIGARREQLRDERSRRQAETADLATRRRALVEQLATWAQAYREALEREQRLGQEEKALEEENAALRRTTESQQARLAEAHERMRKLAARREQLETRLDILRAARQQQLGFDAAVRAVLGAAGQFEDPDYTPPTTLEGIVGVVARLIRVPAGLEQAIEAALAENLQAIVAERQSDALAALELVEREQTGRVTIYPLDTLREIRPLNLTKERGIVGVASQLVRCESRHRTLIDTLLGRTIVVENADVARVVLKRGLGSVVTLQGLLLRPVGSLSSGTWAAAREALVEGRDLHEIPEELRRLDLERGETEGQVESLDRSLAETRQTLSANRSRLEEMSAPRSAARAALAEERGRLATLRGELRWLDQEAGHRAAALAAADRELATLEKEQEALGRRQSKAEEESVAPLREGLEELAARRAAALEELAQARSALAALEVEERALGPALESRRAAIERLEGQLASRRAQDARLEEESQAATAGLESIRAEREQVEASLEGLGGDLEPARQERSQLESRVRGLRDELSTAQEALLAAERARMEADGRVQRREQELDSLREAIEGEHLTVTESGEVRMAAAAEEAVPAWMAADGGSESLDSPTDELPPIRGGAQPDAAQMKEHIGRLRSQLRSLGPVDSQAHTDYAETKERHDFLAGQMEDLQQAEKSLRQAISELRTEIRQRFRATFRRVDREFGRYFETFFGGGHARLALTDAGDGEHGVDIVAQPPGKRLGSLSLLSGGERSLTAVSLLFALLQTHASPFCVLDEVDAMLDDANVGRFAQALRQLAKRTQFIIITHNRLTIETADAIYGISMGSDSTSSVLSLRLADVEAQ